MTRTNAGEEDKGANNETTTLDIRLTDKDEDSTRRAEGGE